jgi:hypothetical protein
MAAPLYRRLAEPTLVTALADTPVVLNQGRRMKQTNRIGISLAVAVFAIAASSASLANNMDAVVGDWTLNVSKSHFNPAPAMKKFTIKVTKAGEDHYLVKGDWIEADGSAGHIEYTSAFDGKPVPTTGYPAVDTVKATRVNATTWKLVFTKNGKVVEREVETISADGKTIRDMDQGKEENGKSYNDRLVFDKG